MPLNIQSEFNSENENWEIKLGGEVDIATAQTLRDLFKTKYAETNADFVLDLSDLNYIDSTGLGVIIGAFGRLKEEGHKVCLHNPKENVAKLLRITNLDKILCA